MSIHDSNLIKNQKHQGCTVHVIGGEMCQALAGGPTFSTSFGHFWTVVDHVSQHLSTSILNIVLTQVSDI